MSFPQWQCPENLKATFLKFLKASNDNKHSQFNNLAEYEELKQHFPLSKEIKKELKQFTDKPPECIEICESEEEPDISLKTLSIKPQVDEHNDLIETILDCINTEEQVSQDIFEELSLLGKQPLETVFQKLSEKCSLEECRIFWVSLSQSPHKYLQESFVEFMLISKLSQQFVNDSRELFNGILLNNRELIEDKLLKALLNKGEANTVLLQYVTHLDHQFKVQFFGKLVTSMKKFHPSYILTIESLLLPEAELPIVKNLLELMAGAAPDFSQDNAYGKLLFKLVDSLEDIPENMGKPLRRILEFHRSIWKMKVEKMAFRKMGEFNLTQGFL